MTFIGIETTPATADIYTDTWSYMTNARTLGSYTKVLPILHLKAAVVVQGSVAFGSAWKGRADQLSETATTFDEFNELAPERIRQAWRGAQGEGRADFGPALVLHVGFSSERKTFETVAFHSFTGFEPEILAGPFVHPSPLGIKPSDYELVRYAKGVVETDNPEHRTTLEANFKTMTAWPLMADEPRTPEEWTEIAETARQDRSIRMTVASQMKILVGGELHRTRLSMVGGIYQQRIHSFNDQGEELAQVVRGTAHPLAQLAPCSCGSDKMQLECCTAPYLDEPCQCGSGANLRACCAVASVEAVEALRDA